MHRGSVIVYYNNNIKIELCSKRTVVSDLVHDISCNIVYLSKVIHLLRFHENARDFIEFFTNKIFPLIPKTKYSILCGLYNLLHLTAICEYVNSLPSQRYFQFISKPTRL